MVSEEEEERRTSEVSATGGGREGAREVSSEAGAYDRARRDEAKVEKEKGLTYCVRLGERAGKEEKDREGEREPIQRRTGERKRGMEGHGANEREGRLDWRMCEQARDGQARRSGERVRSGKARSPQR